MPRTLPWNRIDLIEEEERCNKSPSRGWSKSPERVPGQMTNLPSEKVIKVLNQREKRDVMANGHILNERAMSSIILNYQSQRSLGQSK